MMSSEKSNSTRDSQGALSCGEEKYTFSFLAMTSTARLLLTAGSWLPKELPAVNKTIFLSSWQGKDNNLSAVLQLQQICSPAGTGGAGALRRYLMFRFLQASFFFYSLRQINHGNSFGLYTQEGFPRQSPGCVQSAEWSLCNMDKMRLFCNVEIPNGSVRFVFLFLLLLIPLLPFFRAPTEMSNLPSLNLIITSA